MHGVCLAYSRHHTVFRLVILRQLLFSCVWLFTTPWTATSYTVDTTWKAGPCLVYSRYSINACSIPGILAGSVLMLSPSLVYRRRSINACSKNGWEEVLFSVRQCQGAPGGPEGWYPRVSRGAWVAQLCDRSDRSKPPTPGPSGPPVGAGPSGAERSRAQPSRPPKILLWYSNVCFMYSWKWRF